MRYRRRRFGSLPGIMDAPQPDTSGFVTPGRRHSAAEALAGLDISLSEAMMTQRSIRRIFRTRSTMRWC